MKRRDKRAVIAPSYDRISAQLYGRFQNQHVNRDRRAHFCCAEKETGLADSARGNSSPKDTASMPEIVWLANARICVCWLVESLTGTTGLGASLPSAAPHWHLSPQLQGASLLFFAVLQQDAVVEQQDVVVEQQDVSAVPQQTSLLEQQLAFDESLADEHPQSAPGILSGCTSNMSMADHVMNGRAKLRIVLNETTLVLPSLVWLANKISVRMSLDDSTSSKLRQDG